MFRRGGSSVGQSIGLIIRGSSVRARPAPQLCVTLEPAHFVSKPAQNISGNLWEIHFLCLNGTNTRNYSMRLNVKSRNVAVGLVAALALATVPTSANSSARSTSSIGSLGSVYFSSGSSVLSPDAKSTLAGW